MSIIEKLGITPGPWESLTVDEYREAGKESEIDIKSVKRNFEDITDHSRIVRSINEGWEIGVVTTFQPGEDGPDANLIAAAPEMLERDIKFLRHLDGLKKSIIEDQEECGDDYSVLIDIVDQIKDAFDFYPDEKATGKSWSEIKELL